MGSVKRGELEDCADDFTSRRFMLDDLQLAAELGKTLLERNKELETALRQHQNVIEDQAQEIEYLTKQTVALREVNDSRLRIYEQLEVSIQDLERANNRLALDHSADKKHIKSLCCNVETLEAKCEEQQKTVDELQSQLEMARRRAERKAEPPDDGVAPKPAPVVQSTPKKPQVKQSSPVEPLPPPLDMTQEHEDLMRINEDLRESKAAFAQEQRRVTELEEQLASMVQENNRLQERLREWTQRELGDEPKSMHEEFSILEEVRLGQVCVRCLRGADDASSMMEDDDDRSAISSLLAATPGGSPRTHNAPLASNKFIRFESGREKLLQSAWNTQDGENPYRELVQKYEALLEVQLSQVKHGRAEPPPPSLHDELQTSGDFARYGAKETDDEKSRKPERKKTAQTPDFSEAETSSSGFSDETSNKGTQTERERPGSFLCTIADGEDYRFSIYDDAAPMESRFRDRPEYRALFREIFAILKKAAENKDEGERLPLLDDVGKTPPVTPARDQPPDTEDAGSVFSSVVSEQSIPLSDASPPDVTLRQSDVAVVADQAEREVLEEKKEKVLTPLVRQPLEYVAATRKKSRHRRRHSQERPCDSPVFPSPPRVTYQKGSGRKRREYRPAETSPLARDAAQWNGATMQFYNRSVHSPAPSSGGSGCKVHQGGSGGSKVYQSWNPETDSWETKQSTASQEIHKLRKLELSYAEVLRNADKNKGRRKKHQ